MQYRMRPCVTINCAMSADGKISTRERRQVKISGSRDFARVDRLKAASDAVMVGIGTVLADDPSLTVKDRSLTDGRMRLGKPPHPVRIVVDSAARTPLSAKILHKGEGPRVIAVSANAPKQRVHALSEVATIVTAGHDAVDLPALLDELACMGIRSLMVEGGGTLLWSFFSEGLFDDFFCYVGNMVIGGRDAPTPAEGLGFLADEGFVPLRLVDLERCDEGVVLHWQPVRGT
jgi:2,5-diamino-6-(ribosylamino)-4(3H)-pyrimidinone 5'-phosphate reductase